MIKKFQFKLIDYIIRKKKNVDSAFTLVELIVVIVIIGILSSIAVPAFRSAGDKARQKEATTLISSYLKAAQAYQTEFGTAAQNASHLSEYIQVTGCSQATAAACATLAPTAVTGERTTWNAPSGSFSILMNYNLSNERTTFTGTSTGTPVGKGVSGCYNNSTGASKITELTTAGTVATPEC